MHPLRSKKIFFYIFLFLIIGTFNNKNLNDINFPNIKKIDIIGLDDKSNFQLKQKLNFLKINNLFSIRRSFLKSFSRAKGKRRFLKKLLIYFNY